MSCLSVNLSTKISKSQKNKNKLKQERNINENKLIRMKKHITHFLKLKLKWKYILKKVIQNII